MKTLVRCVVFVVAIVLSVANDSRLTIFKCCKFNEELQLIKHPSEKLPPCGPSSTEWKPLIYSRIKEAFDSDLLADWHVLEDRRPECDNRSELIHVPCDTLNPVILFDDGNAMVNDERYSVGQYCADSKAIIACVQKKSPANHAAATMRRRVRRCCGENAAFHEHGNTCVHVKEIVDAPSLLPNASSIVEIVTGFPICEKSKNFTILGDAKDATLQPDGGLKINEVVLPNGQFCIERIKELNHVAKVFACPEHSPQRPVIQSTDIRFTLYPVGFIISAVFLAITLAAGWLLPASHHVLHWRCQTYHVTCLMLGDILMAIIQLAGDSLHGVACKALAIMAHFFFLATFFWLNTMCFNIWWTFRDLRPVSLEKGQEILRLRVYACYAWGGPLLVAGLAALLDHLPPQPQYTFLRPRFGEKQCWFYGKVLLKIKVSSSLLWLFCGHVLSSNILQFSSTITNLIRFTSI